MGNELLDQGLTLMLAGMGTVFAFLTVLVFAMTLMSKLAMRFSAQTASTDVSDEEVAAISAAILRHRNN
jgi:oxaloacetate decarboxylase gamma subunit